MPNLSFRICQWEANEATDKNQDIYIDCEAVDALSFFPRYPVLQSKDHGFLDIKLHCDFRFAGTHVTIGTGWIEDTWDEQLLPEVGTFVQEDLMGRESYHETSERSSNKVCRLVPWNDFFPHLNSVGYGYKRPRILEEILFLNTIQKMS